MANLSSSPSLDELHRRRFAHLPLWCGASLQPGVMDEEEWRDWTSRETSPDQRRIGDYLDGFNLGGKRILHIGVGNSSLANRFAHRALEIVGTTVVDSEAKYGAGLGHSNYRVIVHNKYSGEDRAFPVFEFIVDNNPTSFCCCLTHLNILLSFFESRLAKGGQVLLDSAGMAWTPATNPKWGFAVEELARVAELSGLKCYRVGRHNYALARERPEKPSVAWRTGLEFRSAMARLHMPITLFRPY